MPTANQRLFDETVRHHVQLLRFGERQADDVAALLAESEQELLDKIVGAMARGRDASRWEELLTSVRDLRSEVMASVGRVLEHDLRELASSDAEWEEKTLQGVSPVELSLSSVPVEQLRAIVDSPINGLPLKSWLDGIADREAQALQRAVSLAVLQGESVDDLVRRIRGTRANGFEDGILSTTTRNAQALARTAVSHVSNQAREAVWEANSSVVRALRWTSTLDGRTSSVCQGRDGKLAAVGDSQLLPSDPELMPAGARPPAHFNCRSVMVAVMDGVELAGDRPFVADARTRAKRERDFRRTAKEDGVPLSEVRRRWAEERVGTLPARTDYSSWLAAQSQALQDEILGPARAKLFRAGAPLERFTDASGRRLTLRELRGELGLD